MANRRPNNSRPKMQTHFSSVPLRFVFYSVGLQESDISSNFYDRGVLHFPGANDSWTSATSGHGCPHQNVYFQGLESLSEVFGPGHLPGCLAGRLRQTRPKILLLGLLLRT